MGGTGPNVRAGTTCVCMFRIIYMRLQEEKRKEGPLSVSIPCMAVSHLSDLAVLLIGDLRMLFAKTRTVFKRIGGPEQKLSVPVVL